MAHTIFTSDPSMTIWIGDRYSGERSKTVSLRDITIWKNYKKIVDEQNRTFGEPFLRYCL